MRSWIADLAALIGFALLIVGLYLELGLGMAAVVAGAILLILGVTAVWRRGVR